MADSNLLEEIVTFCTEHSLSSAKFGVLALNDWKLVQDLTGCGRSAPRRLWPETENRVREFMAKYGSLAQAERR
jgi:hypothetical protein